MMEELPRPPSFQIVPVLTMGFSLLLTDLLFYGILVPIFGATIAAAGARAFELSGFYEIYLVILAVVATFYFMFNGFKYLLLETMFWRSLFAREKGYMTILQIRDLVNLYALYCSVRLLYQAVDSSEMQGIGLKQDNLGEGIGFVVWNGLIERGYTIPQYIAEHYPWTPEVQKSSFWSWSIGSSSMSDQNAKNIQMINGAKLVLAIAGITSSIMKLSYFTGLHCYLRAMKLFTQMQDDSPPQTPGGTESLHSIVSESVAFHLNTRDHKQPAPLRSRSNTSE